MAIPQIIHYCWFGPKEFSDLELKCIESWKKHFPDYELMFWNERTFDINAYQFSKQAYEKKQFAFVSDLVRTVVLAKYGGIYLDTDIEILSDFRELLKNKELVLGFENRTFVGTALMASIPQHSIILDFARYYQSKHFLGKNGEMDIIANPILLAEVLKNHNFLLDGQDQEQNDIAILHRDYFFPKKINDANFRITEKTVAIHHFNASWLTERQKKRGQNKFWIEVCRPTLRTFKSGANFIFGKERTNNIEIKIKNLLR